MRSQIQTWTQHPELIQWILAAVHLCRPKDIHLCSGSEEEFDLLCHRLVQAGIFTPLNPKKHPESYWCHSHPDDVARVEKDTYICSQSREEAGPTNYWADPEEMKQKMHQLFSGCMEGRTLYVVPFCMGQIDSSLAKIGIQITDSAYVAVNMHIMTHMGDAVIKKLGNKGTFVPCMHSVGVPLKEGKKDMPWPCNPEKRYIVHFPKERAIWSFGSGYGGNALLGKKCLALRIASVIGRDEGWLAEHMLIMGITNPEGEKRYFTGAFPSACGKTNLAMISSVLPGWKVETVGDDIAWMKIKSDGRLYAINPEAGLFGVAPGTSTKTNPAVMQMLKRHTIFTNVALTKERNVWWEGMTDLPPKEAVDWKGHPWNPSLGTKAAHPNARFTVPLSQSPSLDPNWNNPEGVPISGIIFGGRRSSVIPLVFEAFNWKHGTFLGSSICSEMTAAAAGEIGKLRHDPFAMLPFCGYHMGDYFAHWLEMGDRLDPEVAPKIFYVNWFRKSKEGSYLWPGFQENMRVLQWCFERISHKAAAKRSPIGWVPESGSLNLKGLSLPSSDLEELLHVDPKIWLKEVDEMENYYYLFGDRLPEALRLELDSLRQRLLLSIQ